MTPRLFTLACVLGMSVAGQVMAQDFPKGPITMLHGFAPGGSADTVARLVAQPLSERLGVPVVVEAKPGAGGTLASAAIGAAAADGQTIGLVTGGHAVSAGLYNQLPYDSVDDFDWLSMVVEYDFMLAVPADSEFQTLAELLASAKANPGDIGYGSAGVGSTHHLTGLLLADMADVELEHFPYRGEAGAVTGLLGGEIPLIIASPVTLASQISAGAMRPLAVTGKARLASMPDVPTVAEAGVEGFEVMTWSGIAAPKGLAPEVADKLRTEIQAVLAQPEVASAIVAAIGGTIDTTGGDEMKARVASEVERWTKVINDAGLEKQ